MDQGPGGSGKPRRSRADPPDNAYWRENTLWGRITVKGREIRWSLRTSNAAVARRRIEDRRKLEVAKAHFGEVRHTYADVMDAWSEIIVKKVGAGTANRYGVSLKQLEPWLKDAFFDEIDRELIKEIANERMKKVKVATVRRDLTALSNLFEFAFDENIVDRNYALERMKALKERRDPIILPEHRHIDMVIARAPKSLAAMARVALNEGARQAEIVYARRSRIDHYRKQLVIVGKGNRLRTIDLSDPSYEIICSLPVALGSDFIFHHNGEPYRNVSSRFRDVVRRTMLAARKQVQGSAQWPHVDFREFRFHDLRHRFAVDYLKNGGNIYFLQKHMGHKSIKTTEIYLDYLTPEEAHRAKYAAQSPAQEQRFHSA